jgi:very-short-patch-repair endonuclease
MFSRLRGGSSSIGDEVSSSRKSRRDTTNQTTRFAKELRRTMTPAERLLWSRLRRNTLGRHFRRKAPIGKYVLDFYCAGEKLAIEVDGDVHADTASIDAERTAWLEKEKHIRMIRVTNQDVFNNIDGVVDFILQEIVTTPAPPPLPSPAKKIT